MISLEPDVDSLHEESYLQSFNSIVSYVIKRPGIRPESRNLSFLLFCIYMWQHIRIIGYYIFLIPMTRPAIYDYYFEKSKRYFVILVVRLFICSE